MVSSYIYFQLSAPSLMAGEKSRVSQCRAEILKPKYICWGIYVKLLHKRTSVQNKGTSVIANRIPIDYPMHDVSVYVVSQS